MHGHADAESRMTRMLCRLPAMRAAARLLGAKLQSAVAVRIWLPAVLLVACASVLLMPVNRAIGASCYGDSCTDEHMLVQAAPQMYTSGIFIGHVTACLMGALVIARGREHCWAKLVAAALAGTTLGVVQVSVALPLAASRLRTDPLARHTGDPIMLASHGVRQAILVSFLAYPLWALLGLGIGLKARSRAKLVALILATPVLLAVGSLGLLTPTSAILYVAVDPTPFTAAFLLCTLAGLAALPYMLGARPRQ